MENQIESLLAEITGFRFESATDLENYKRRFTGRKGMIPALFEELKQLSPTEKKQFGQRLNELKQTAEARLKAAEAALAGKSPAATGSLPDLTLPGKTRLLGGRHPLAITRRRVLEIFQRLGYNLAFGPEIEDDWHNFSALNFEANHPARDMQDTFFVVSPENGQPDYLLRTHTTNVQIHYFENNTPPIRILMPGRVYRNEAVSARAHCFFHQIDGVALDEGISYADMRQTLFYFAHSLFGTDIQIRFRPSYFPFTEISAEMDISCQICQGKGCNICKYSGWVEILGCGMIDPNVLANTKIDATRYSGFAFGMGIERIAQLLFRVPDLRLYSQNDIRFLSQFATLA
jgi:phenylalanyl-tRNA synthetase alpha chain